MPAPSSHAPLRVALLSPCYWPEVRRGTERFLSELAAGLIARGHRPTLITSHPGRPSRRVEDGLAVVRLPRPPIEPLLGRYVEQHLTHVPLSYFALSRGEFDVAHAVYPTDALAAARWRGRSECRAAVLSYMGIPSAEWLDAQRARRAILERAVRGCDAVVALSDHAAAAFERSVPVSARVIAPGVDLTAFAPAARRSADPTVVCSAAADVPRKRVGVLVEALSLVREHHPRTRLILSRTRDLAAAQRAGVDIGAPGLEWRNLDDRGALARAYGEAWVTALPSVDEAFGLVLVEALASGTPVAGFAGGAIPEIIDRPQIGRLFGSLDAPAVAAALLECFALAGEPAAGRGRDTPRRVALAPRDAIFAEHPGTRTMLYRGVFWNVWHYLLWRSLLAFAGPRWLRRMLVARHLRELRQRAAGLGSGTSAVPFLLLYDAVESAAVVTGAVRSRTVVL